MRSVLRLYWFVSVFVVTFGVEEAISQTDFWQQTNGPYGGGISALAINTSGTIFAGMGNLGGSVGVYRSVGSTTSVRETSPHRPMACSLDQNYPNPFNPSTTIRYGPPQKSAVELSVYNTLGQQVALLQHGEQEAGSHEVRFDGSNLASGIYFYRLQAGAFVEAKKFVLVR